MSYCRQHLKKLILAAFLSLLLNGCSTTSDIMSSTNFQKGWSKGKVKNAFYWAGTKDDPFIDKKCFTKYYSETKREILSTESQQVYFVFENVTWPRSSCKYTDTGNGTLLTWTRNFEEAKNLAASKNIHASNTQPRKKIASKPKKSAPKKSNSSASSGSAFFVTQRGHIITNYHVVQGCRTNPKIKYKNKDIDTKVIAKDQLLDLALLKADLTNTKYVSLSKKQPRKLQRIIASGYPFGKYISDDLKFTSGIVSSLKGPNDDSTLVQVDAALNPGNSGGPIVDEESGQLVAVSVMGMKKNISEGQNFGIKTSSVKSFLDANQIKTPSSFGVFKSVDVAKLLEDSTLYTFCR